MILPTPLRAPLRPHAQVETLRLIAMIENLDAELLAIEKQRAALVAELRWRDQPYQPAIERRRALPLSVIPGEWLTPEQPGRLFSSTSAAVRVYLNGEDVTQQHVTLVDLDAGFVQRGHGNNAYKTYGQVELRYEEQPR